MLFLSPGTSQILRGQGTYLSDEEIGRVMAAVGTSEPQYAAELVNLQPAPSADAAAAGSPKDKDEMYDAAVEVVIREGRGSVSLLQRALGVGYGRGARLIDFMAEDGVVGMYAGSQAREILLTMEQWEAKKAARNSPTSPSPRRLKIQPHADGSDPPLAAAGKPDRRAEKPAKKKPASRGVDMTAHAASMKPHPGAAAAPGTQSLPALPSIAVRPLGVSPHDVDEDRDESFDEEIAIPSGRASLGRQPIEVEVENDEEASGSWDDAEEDDEEETEDAFAEEDESESFIVDADEPEADSGDDEAYEDEDSDDA